MRTLYQFPFSPFSRRVRLALAHKGLAVELRDSRADATIRDEARIRYPLGTIPVFVDEDGTTLGDSTVISDWLDARYPSPPLWPRDAPSLALTRSVARQVDAVLDLVIDLGTRYYPLHRDPEWTVVKEGLLARAHAGLREIVRLVPTSRETVLASGWSAVDIWLYTMVAWLDGLPARAAGYPPAAQIVSLGLILPPELSRWTAPHHGREDVRAL